MPFSNLHKGAMWAGGFLILGGVAPGTHSLRLSLRLPSSRAALVLWVPPGMNGGTLQAGGDKRSSGHHVTPAHPCSFKGFLLFPWPPFIIEGSLAAPPTPSPEPAFPSLPLSPTYRSLHPQAQSMIPINEPYADGKCAEPGVGGCCMGVSKGVALCPQGQRTSGSHCSVHMYSCLDSPMEESGEGAVPPGVGRGRKCG